MGLVVSGTALRVQLQSLQAPNEPGFKVCGCSHCKVGGSESSHSEAGSCKMWLCNKPTDSIPLLVISNDQMEFATPKLGLDVVSLTCALLLLCCAVLCCGCGVCDGVQVVQGYVLGLSPPSNRFIAVVKHEGTEEHA